SIAEKRPLIRESRIGRPPASTRRGPPSLISSTLATATFGIIAISPGILEKRFPPSSAGSYRGVNWRLEKPHYLWGDSPLPTTALARATSAKLVSRAPAVSSAARIRASVKIRTSCCAFGGGGVPPISSAGWKYISVKPGRRRL